MKNKMNKKGMAPLIILIAIGVIALIATGTINLKTASLTGSGDYIERPVFKYVKCEAVGILDYTDPISIATNGQWITNKPTVTNYYNVEVTVPARTGLSIGGSRIEYYICNSMSFDPKGCRTPVSVKKEFNGQAGTLSITNVKPNEYVWIQYQHYSALRLGWVAASGASYQVGFIPYGLREYNVLGGSAIPIKDNDCTIDVSYGSFGDQFISSTSSKVNSAYGNAARNTNENTLHPEEVRWYVSGYVSSAAPSFALTYNGQSAWCSPAGTSANIFKINTVTLGSGTYKIASADWSDYLGSEKCCPGDKQGGQTCNKNYAWEQTAGTQCSAFNPCGGSEWSPYANQKIVRYSCVNGYCKPEYKDVECASNADCVLSNQICSLSTHTCVDANVNVKGQKLEEIPDNKMDCEKNGGKWITKTTKDTSIWNWIGIGEPKVVVKEYCQTVSWWDYIWLTFGIVGIIIIGFLLIKFGLPFFKAIISTIRGFIPFI